MIKIAVFTFVAVLIVTTSLAYAGKPADSLEKATGRPAEVTEWVNSVKSRVAGLKAAKVKKVHKLYFYESTVTEAALETGRADYTMWGMMIHNSNKDLVVFNAHGLEAGRDYVLQYDSIEVATGTANEFGDLHLKGTVAVEAWDTREGKFTLVSDGSEVLMEHGTKIKPMAEETE